MRARRSYNVQNGDISSSTPWANCPCGKHMAVVVTARVVSAGVVGDVIKKMECLQEGWLQ